MDPAKNIHNEETADQRSSPFRDVVPIIRKTKPISLSSVMAVTGTATMQSDQPCEGGGDVSQPPTSSPLEKAQRNNNFDNTDISKQSSRLEATFIHPGNGDDPNPSNVGKSGYHALAVDFTTSASSTSTSDKRCALASSTDQLVEDVEVETVLEAMLAFILAIFGPVWTLGIGYLHYSKGVYAPALLTCVGLFISIICTTVAYILPSKSPKKEVWKGCKLVWLLCLIPGMAPIILSFCNIIFATRESGSRSYERPWKGTRSIFLVESLSLAFPQSLLHLVMLVEDAESLHTYQGYATITGVIIFSFSITFARFRYDILSRMDRFGVSYEKIVGFICLWANKGLWITTFTLAIICARLAAPSHGTNPIIAGIALVFLVHEIPLLLLTCPPLARRASSLLGGLMMIPQITALTALLIWVNLNPALYTSDTGSMLLGIFFWAELIILSGWLYDRCLGREIDFISYYPHFFGDICSNLRT